MEKLEKEQPRLEKRGTWYRLCTDHKPVLAPKFSMILGPAFTEEEERYMPAVPRLIEIVRRNWKELEDSPKNLDEHVANVEDGFPELEEWTSTDTCLRFLRAVQGNEAVAAQMLTKAIEVRVKDRELYSTMKCEVTCDIRVIGRDLQRRPVVYMCAGSQKCPLKDMVPQLCLAFEAAVRLSQNQGCGQVIMVADMHNFSPSLNMDLNAFKELGASFGTVFADRFAFILIVDFSFLARGMWSMCKPLLSDRTQQKINFVGLAKAKELVKERFMPPTTARVISAFDINRDRRTTEEDRQAHAHRTSICDVPLGTERPADLAG